MDNPDSERLNIENTEDDEIKRLRRIIQKYEDVTQMKVITVEIVNRTDRPGVLIYVSAPTATNEVEFSMAIAYEVMRSLQVVGMPLHPDPEFIDLTQALLGVKRGGQIH